MRSRIGRRAAVVLLAVASLAAGCGAGETGRPTIVVGSTNFGEQEILGEIYATALEAHDYPVERRFQLGTREVVNPALKAGEIDLLAEYTGSLLTYEGGTPSTDPAQTWGDLAAVLAPFGLVALEYAPAQDRNGLAVTAATAEELGLARISDLARYNGQLVLGGPPECPERPLCLPGLESLYGLEFTAFQPLDRGGPLTVAALEGGEIDVGVLFTSDGVIAAKGFVLLEDDRSLQPADNVVPVVRREIVDAYGEPFTALVDSITARITTSGLSELNRRYAINAEDAAALAREWLQANGFPTT